MDNPFKSPAVISVCTGLRGIERGLKRAIRSDVRVAAYVEIEAFVIANLIAAMEAGKLAPAPIWPDVKTFQAERFRGKIHGIVGGYPCQPFSQIGLGGGIYDPRHLYPYFSRIIQATGLVWAFFENVANHLQVGFDTVYADLRRMGFAVEAGIYTAAEVGASHLRERLFILAIKEEVLDHAQREGLERYGWNEYGEKRCQAEVGSATEASVFPAFFGEQQYNWEAARVLESRMGCPNDGYDYTEDLLRALGNSVVPQTAELAFRSLLQKHINNLNK